MGTKALFAAFALAIAHPSAAQVEQHGLKAAEDALVTGDAERAVELLRALVADSPEDSDLLRRLAVAQAAAGRLDEALSTIDLAARIAPNDYDVRLQRARILTWLGLYPEAEAEAARIVAAAPGYPELDAVVAAIDAARGSAKQTERAPVGASVSFQSSHISFDSGSADDWSGLRASASVRLRSALAISAAAEWEKRRQTDVRASVRFDARAGGGSWFAVAAVTPNADFRETWSLTAGGTYPVAESLEVLLDARYADYDENSVGVLQPGVRYRATDRAALSVRWINLADERSYKHGISGRLDWNWRDNGNLYAGAATYPDTEAGVTRQVKSLFAGAVYPLDEGMTLRAAAEYDRRSDSYRRYAGLVGLSFRLGS